MAKYPSALSGSQMDTALLAFNQIVLVNGVVYSDGDGTFSAMTVDTTPASGSSNLITSGGAYTAINAKYTKPATGIPKADLASAVQASLDKADAAVEQDSSSLTFTAGRDSNGFYIVVPD